MPWARAILFVIAATSVGACASGYSLTVAATQCDLTQHQRLVGMNIGEVTLPPQLHYREISPGQLVTQEYQPGRLNIFLDPKGWIARVTCG
ncbi:MULTISPECIES: I78 family peptidase inhibitor [Paracoccus]|uniref:Peptidase inhibitor I78 family protein n=1 Tax=Paracoccus aerius TaxID=1915382 RepID=A0ABS1S6J1_9RHOB|nr:MULTISPECIES: I78 family peptidase inhibitor [Paracoccus]MBL3674348.1 hypothetical protein [Paracoccus aerius]QIR85252.1 hypothetical protein FIU66_08560 [Paracoccus sp. AK26]GHG24994.1 hypothetical protein GCM10017322_23890 [Paracoccus aerius]